MWSKRFWLKTAERAAKTVAQSALAVIGVSTTGLLDVYWVGVGSVAALAGVVSVLTSLASCGVGDFDSPSLVQE